MSAMDSWLDLNITDVTCAEPEDALDTLMEWLECELLEGDEFIVVHGITADVDPAQYGWPSDPHFRAGNDPIRKKVRVDELPETRARWQKLCRSVTRVSCY